MADVRGSGGIMLSQAEQGMKLFKAAEAGATLQGDFHTPMLQVNYGG